MDYCRKLFEVARAVQSASNFELPYPRGFEGPCPPVGTCRFTTRIAYGAARQFYRWRRQVFAQIVRTLGGQTDRVLSQAQRGLKDLLGQFFGGDPDAPALLWMAPVWVTTSNWITAAGLKPHDTTLPMGEHSLSSVGDPLHQLTFSSLKSIHVPVQDLTFYYPDRRVRTLLHVPRRRYLEDTAGALWRGYEEGIGLGDLREQEALKRGVYTPSQNHYQIIGDTSFLDQLTVMFARLTPFPPRRPAPPVRLDAKRFNKRILTGPAPLPPNRFSWQAILAERGLDTSRFAEPAPDEPLPTNARVEFVRLTFDPSTMSIVVVLAAERDFHRFLAEHCGLSELLALAFTIPGSGA